MPSTQLNWSWLAGFFDGEGCISVRRSNYQEGMMAETVNVQLHQKDVGILDSITEFLYSELGITPYLGNSHGCFFLQYSRGEHVIALLEKLVPHLIVKQQFAKEALDFMVEMRELQSRYGFHWRKHVDQPVAPIRARLRGVV